MLKTSEFIKILQKEDPNDEAYICVGNNPVSFVEKLPSWYDGRMVWIERDENYKVIKAGYPKNKLKLKIHYTDLEDVLLDNPDIDLILDGITYNGVVNERYANMIEQWRQAGREYQKWTKQLKENHAKGLPPPPFPKENNKSVSSNRFIVWIKNLIK